jgi:hypothetical protein
MPDIELHIFPRNEEKTSYGCEHLNVKIIGEDYFRLDIDRIHREKKPRVVIHQDALGDLIIVVGNERIYDEREK